MSDWSEAKCLAKSFFISRDSQHDRLLHVKPVSSLPLELPQNLNTQFLITVTAAPGHLPTACRGIQARVSATTTGRPLHPPWGVSWSPLPCVSSPGPFTTMAPASPGGCPTPFSGGLMQLGQIHREMAPCHPTWSGAGQRWTLHGINKGTFQEVLRACKNPKVYIPHSKPQTINLEINRKART